MSQIILGPFMKMRCLFLQCLPAITCSTQRPERFVNQLGKISSYLITLKSIKATLHPRKTESRLYTDSNIINFMLN